jgi:hypothetical protein
LANPPQTPQNLAATSSKTAGIRGTGSKPQQLALFDPHFEGLFSFKAKHAQMGLFSQF